MAQVRGSKSGNRQFTLRFLFTELFLIGLACGLFRASVVDWQSHPVIGPMLFLGAVSVVAAAGGMIFDNTISWVVWVAAAVIVVALLAYGLVK